MDFLLLSTCSALAISPFSHFATLNGRRHILPSPVEDGRGRPAGRVRPRSRGDGNSASLRLIHMASQCRHPSMALTAIDENLPIPFPLKLCCCG